MCLFLKRTRKGMIRLLDWYPLTRNVKQINGPKSLYLHKLVLVNVSSAIVIVAGSLPSTSHTGVQRTNTGSGSSIILTGMPWAPCRPFAPYRCSCAHTTLPIRKGQGTVSFTFPDTNVNRRELPSLAKGCIYFFCDVSKVCKLTKYLLSR